MSVRSSSSGPAPTAPTTTSLPAAAATPSRVRRPRLGLKRTKFAVPQAMPRPVKALWAAATPEAQARAHRAATAILRTWLGKATREEAAKELELTPLRFWQLSQQAVAGLVAGLLHQPRVRGSVVPGEAPAEESAGVLRRRIAALERELDGARRLIGLLKELPTPRVATTAPGTEAGDGGKRRRRGGRAAAGAVDAGTGVGPRGEAGHGAS